MRCPMLDLSGCIDEWTYDLALTAVKHHPWDVKIIPKKFQTDELISLAGTIDGSALHYLADQTKKYCLLAVTKNGLALQYVKNQDKELCLAAVKQNGKALKYVQIQTQRICNAAALNKIALRYIKSEFRTDKIKKSAKKYYGCDIDQIPKKIIITSDFTEHMCIAAVLENYLEIKNVPIKLQTEKLYNHLPIWRIHKILGRKLVLPIIHYVWRRLYIKGKRVNGHALTYDQRYTLNNLGKAKKYSDIRMKFVI